MLLSYNGYIYLLLQLYIDLVTYGDIRTSIIARSSSEQMIETGLSAIMTHAG
jgi:hypothetical protein